MNKFFQQLLGFGEMKRKGNEVVYSVKMMNPLRFWWAIITVVLFFAGGISDVFAVLFIISIFLYVICSFIAYFIYFKTLKQFGRKFNRVETRGEGFGKMKVTYKK